MENNKRFGLIPLSTNNGDIAVPGEFLIDPNTGHIYIKKDNGELYSKTLEMEKRIEAIESVIEMNSDVINIPGHRLYEFVSKSETILSNVSEGYCRYNDSTASSFTFHIDKLSIPYTKMFTYYIAVSYRYKDSNYMSATMCITNKNKVTTVEKPMVRVTNYNLPSETYTNRTMVFVAPADLSEYLGGSVTFKITGIPENYVYNVTIYKRLVTESSNSFCSIHIDTNNYVGILGSTPVIDNNSFTVTSDKQLMIMGHHLSITPGLYNITLNVKNTDATVQVSTVNTVTANNKTKNIPFAKLNDMNGLKVATLAIDITENVRYISIKPTDGTININSVDVTLISTATYDHSSMSTTV